MAELKDVHKNIILTFVIAVAVFIIGGLINFVIIHLLPGDPVMSYLWALGNFSPTPAEYTAALKLLGFDQPLFIQYFRYIGRLFTGDWGISISISVGMPVYEFVRIVLPRTIELIIIPLILGLIVGRILGRLSRKFEDHKIGKYIKVFVAIGIAVPAFVFGVLFQLLGYFSGLPISEYKTAVNPDPPFVTGFLIIDSLIAGQLYLAGDILMHYILPIVALTIITIALVTRQYRSNLENNSLTRSVVSNTTSIGMHFGLFFTSIILIDTTFQLRGFGHYFLDAIISQDFFIILAFGTFIIVFFTITTLISNLVFSLRKEEQYVSLKEIEPELRWKSPFTIIGLIIIGFFVVVATFPEQISQYSFEELKGIFFGTWQPPSPDHPLGQGAFGRDMLGQILWGVPFSILVAIGAVLIGLGGGVLFGLIATKLNELGKNILTGLLLIIYIIPSAILVFLISSIFGLNFLITMVFIGITLIPSFTRIIYNASFLEINVFKSVIKYIPLMIGFAIILFESINFLGFSDPNFFSLGALVAEGRFQIYSYFGFSVFPAIAIVLLVTGFILLYEGL